MKKSEFRCDYYSRLYDVQAALEKFQPVKWQIIKTSNVREEIQYMLAMELDRERTEVFREKE